MVKKIPQNSGIYKDIKGKKIVFTLKTNVQH